MKHPKIVFETSLAFQQALYGKRPIAFIIAFFKTIRYIFRTKKGTKKIHEKYLAEIERLRKESD